MSTGVMLSLAAIMVLVVVAGYGIYVLKKGWKSRKRKNLW